VPLTWVLSTAPVLAAYPQMLYAPFTVLAVAGQ
jgi:hypothetical protein